MGLKLTRQMCFIAKFYDPLYFKEDGEEVGVPFLNVNRSFVQEVAHTTPRFAHLQGVHIPKYFGSFIYSQTPRGTREPFYKRQRHQAPAPTRPAHPGRIHLGKSMDKIPNPVKMFSQEDRKQAMKTIMETDMAFFTGNPGNTDLADRNVMVTCR